MSEEKSASWFTFADNLPAGLSARRCRIEVAHGPDAGVSKEFSSTRIRVGAGKACDFVLTDRRVSRSHIEISLTLDGYRLKDLESTNGTHVGDHRIRDIYVSSGNIIQLGRTKIEFTELEDSFEIPVSLEQRFGDLVGQSVGMRVLFAELERIAPTDACVLINGPVGTGKELVAASLHEKSRRGTQPFVVVDVSAISPERLEGELFGEQGQGENLVGAFEKAHGGTLFVDGVGELPRETQVNLLKVIDSKQVTPLGGSQSLTIDVRVIAATERDLAVEVNKGRFREDLFYRLAVARVMVPALQERREDINLLIDAFLENIPKEAQSLITPVIRDQLKGHDWPGNVRELREAVEQVALMGRSAPWAQQTSKEGGEGQALAPDPMDPTSPFQVSVDISMPFKVAKKEILERFERRYLQALLEEHSGNISAAARAAGMERLSIYKALDRLGLRKK